MGKMSCFIITSPSKFSFQFFVTPSLLYWCVFTNPTQRVTKPNTHLPNYKCNGQTKEYMMTHNGRYNISIFCLLYCQNVWVHHKGATRLHRNSRRNEQKQLAECPLLGDPLLWVGGRMSCLKIIKILPWQLDQLVIHWDCFEDQVRSGLPDREAIRASSVIQCQAP